MRFVAGRVHRGGEAGRGAVAKLLLAGALMRMAGVFLAEMQQLTPKEWQRRSGSEVGAAEAGGRSCDFN